MALTSTQLLPTVRATKARCSSRTLKTMALPRDVKEFLQGYPGVEDETSASRNLQFYSNKFRCEPDNYLIEEIHAQWFGDYINLERKHGFIQWLFPIRERGVNWESQPLQPHEITAMRVDAAIMNRVIRSYELMLDFYGMRLISSDTGLLARVLPPRSYSARYDNLIASVHNYLRISRILKCLSELGLEHLNAGFLLHVLNEQSEKNELNTTGIQTSMDRWWANCLRNSEERCWIAEAIRKVRTEGFMFTKGMYEQALQNRKRTGSLGSWD